MPFCVHHKIRIFLFYTENTSKTIFFGVLSTNGLYPKLMNVFYCVPYTKHDISVRRRYISWNLPFTFFVRVSYVCCKVCWILCVFRGNWSVSTSILKAYRTDTSTCFYSRILPKAFTSRISLYLHTANKMPNVSNRRKSTRPYTNITLNLHNVYIARIDNKYKKKPVEPDGPNERTTKYN